MLSNSDRASSHHFSQEDQDSNCEEKEEFASESSSVRDASVILFHPPDHEECISLNKNLKIKEEILKSDLKDYDDYESSVKVFQKGIEVTKYNYCNETKHKIIIRLS